MPARSAKRVLDTDLDVQVVCATPALKRRVRPVDRQWIARKLREIAAAARVRDGFLHLRLVDDQEMRQLHQQFMNLGSTTDVLSFDLRDDPREPLAADLVVCVDEARRQAKQRGHELRLEILLYGVHGLLHMLGYDDHDPKEYQRMHKREDALLRQAGLPAVFGGDES